MGAVTLAMLRAEAQAMGEYYPPQIAETEMDGYLQSALVAFQIRVTEIDDARLGKVSEFRPDAGDARSLLPEDCEKVLTLAVEDASTPVGYVQLERINADAFYQASGPTSVGKLGVRYLLRAREIEWWPRASGDRIRLLYIPQLADLGENELYDPGFSGWKPWVLSHALMVCAAKLSESTQGWQLIHRAADERLQWQVRLDHARPRRLSGAPPPYPTSKRFRY